MQCFGVDRVLTIDFLRNIFEMKTILEVEVSADQEKLLKDMLTAMNIAFKSQSVEEKREISDEEIGNAIKNCFGIWRDRQDFSDFRKFREQAWYMSQFFII